MPLEPVTSPVPAVTPVRVPVPVPVTVPVPVMTPAAGNEVGSPGSVGPGEGNFGPYNGGEIDAHGKPKSGGVLFSVNWSLAILLAFSFSLFINYEY